MTETSNTKSNILLTKTMAKRLIIAKNKNEKPMVFVPSLCKNILLSI